MQLAGLMWTSTHSSIRNMVGRGVFDFLSLHSFLKREEILSLEVHNQVITVTSNHRWYSTDVCTISPMLKPRLPVLDFVSQLWKKNQKESPKEFCMQYGDHDAQCVPVPLSSWWRNNQFHVSHVNSDSPPRHSAFNLDIAVCNLWCL